MANATEMNGCLKNGSPRKKSRTDDIASKVTVILGAQWGDEGKGKVVDMLATSMDIVCRCQVSLMCYLICGVHSSRNNRKTNRYH